MPALLLKHFCFLSFHFSHESWISVSLIILKQQQNNLKKYKIMDNGESEEPLEKLARQLSGCMKIILCFNVMQVKGRDRNISFLFMASKTK